MCVGVRVRARTRESVRVRARTRETVRMRVELKFVLRACVCARRRARERVREYIRTRSCACMDARTFEWLDCICLTCAGQPEHVL